MYKAQENRYGKMHYRRSGKSGLKLPLVSFGLWHNFGRDCDKENMQKMCTTAFDAGITHFDLANNYGPPYGSAEESFGRVYKDNFTPYRDEMIISTKAGFDMWDGPYGDGGSRKYLLASLDQSLRRTGLDYVDIFYHHRMDPETPVEESMMALDQAVKSGKALYAGISNYDKANTKLAMEIMQDLKCPLIINQRRYSILDRTIEEDGVKQFAKDNGLGIICFSPLAQGLLSEKYLHGIPKDSRIGCDGRYLKETDLTKEKLVAITKLDQLAKKRGQTLPQMALSWVLKDEEITSVLIGASKPEQILENVKAINNISFTQEEIALINSIKIQ
ncbi:MAG TPA: aldo/keto reductase [Candidatus Dorea intestinavium]|nr:aldo/keto reductase [Candidatus Dorea intestinavium]